MILITLSIFLALNLAQPQVCSWNSIPNVYKYSITDSSSGHALFLIQHQSIPSLFGVYIDQNGTIAVNRTIKNFQTPNNSTFSVAGNTDGTFSICFQENFTSIFNLETRDFQFNVVREPFNPFTTQSKNQVECYSNTLVGDNDFIYLFKKPDGFLSIWYFKDGTEYINEVRNFDFLNMNKNVRVIGTGSNFILVPNMNQYYSFRLTEVGNLFATTSYPYQTVNLDSHYFVDAGTEYIIVIYTYTDGATWMDFLQYGYNTEIYDKNVFSTSLATSALDPGIGLLLICTYPHPTITCGLYDALSGVQKYKSITLTAPEVLSGMKAKSLANGRFIISAQGASKTLYYTMIGAKGECGSSMTSKFRCSPHCKSSCLNLGEISFCGMNMTKLSSCAGNCATCASYDSSLCRSCYPSFFLNNITKKCGSTCPNGFYKNSDLSICMKCPTGCSTCSSDKNCTVCEQNFYLDSFMCFSTCPSGFYADNTTNHCERCDYTKCETCIGSPTNCLRCYTGAYFSGNTCVVSCPLGTAGNFWSGKCEKCIPNCKNCSDLSYCNECNSGFFLQPMNAGIQRTCRTDCPYNSGYYPDPTTWKCLKCPIPNCERCSSPTNCTLCSNGIWNGTSCNLDPTCPVGTFLNIRAKRCQTCPNNCSRCSDISGTECAYCDSNFDQTDKKCPCPAGTRFNQFRDCLSIGYLIIETWYNYSSSAFLMRADIMEEVRLGFPNLKFNWSVTANVTDSAKFQQLVTSITSQTKSNFTVDYILLEPNVSYVIECFYTSADSLFSLVQNVTTLNLSHLTPQIFSNDYGINWIPENVITLGAYIVVPYPAFSNSYTFSVVGPVAFTQNSFSNGVNITIKRCVFESKKDYTFKVSTRFMANTLFVGSINYTFSIKIEDFELFVYHLNRIHPKNYPIQLEAYAYFRTQCLPPKSQVLVYSWNCKISINAGLTNKTCRDFDGLFGVNRTTSSLVIPTSYFSLGSILSIEVDVYTTNRKFSKSGWLIVQGTRTVLMNITCRDSQCVKYNPNTELYLVAQNSHDFPRFAYGWETLGNLSTSFNYMRSYFLKSDLTGYSQSKIEVTVKLLDLQYTGVGKMVLPINVPPSYGTVSLTPLSGIAMSTKFTARAQDWYDSDLPMKYQYLCQIGEDYFPLGAATTVPTFTTILPGIKKTQGLNFIINVIDSLDGTTSNPIDLVITGPEPDFESGLKAIYDAYSSGAETDLLREFYRGSLYMYQLVKLEDHYRNLRKIIVTCTGCAKFQTSCQFGICVCLDENNKNHDCTLTKNTLAQIIVFKNTLLSYLSKTMFEIRSLPVALASSVSQAKYYIMKNVNQLTRNSEYVDLQNIMKAVSILNSYIVNSTESYIQTDLAKESTFVLENVLRFMRENDCNCTSKECKSLADTTVNVLKKVSKAALYNLFPGQTPYNISTPVFDIIATKLKVCDLDNLILSLSPTSPVISFKRNFNLTNCSTVLEVQSYAFPNNLFTCGALSPFNLVKDSVMVDIFDTNTGASIKDSVDINLKMPQPMVCPYFCRGDYGDCSCVIDNHQIKQQINIVFQITKINTDPVFNWLRSSVLWAELGTLFWVLGTLMVFCISQSIYKYCIFDKLDYFNQLSKPQGIFLIFLNLNDVCSIYMVHADFITKDGRSLLYFLKLQMYSAFCVFLSSPKQVDLLYLVLIYFTVVPFNYVMKKGIELDFLMKRKPQLKFLSRVLTGFFSLLIFVGSLYIIISYAPENTVGRQSSWIAFFLLCLTFDTVINPFVATIYQLLLIKKRPVLEDMEKTKLVRFLLWSIHDGSEKIHRKTLVNFNGNKIVPFDKTQEIEAVDLEKIEQAKVTKPNTRIKSMMNFQPKKLFSESRIILPEDKKIPDISNSETPEHSPLQAVQPTETSRIKNVYY